jgi:sigma-B regulation protein RsbU (phosphoserine phosphatase)
MARKVQSGLLPQEIPQVRGWEFATLWKPARQVGGDYYDFIPVHGGKTGLVIADVTDKGLGAALFMASTRSVLRASVPMAVSPAEGIRTANSLLSDESRDVLFVTLLYAQIDPVEGTFKYVNAGHNPPLLFHKKNGSGFLTQLQVSGMALGVDPDASYEEFEVNLHPGDFVLLYTDGRW